MFTREDPAEGRRFPNISNMSNKFTMLVAIEHIYRVFFLTGTAPKNSKYKKVNLG